MNYITNLPPLCEAERGTKGVSTCDPEAEKGAGG